MSSPRNLRLEVVLQAVDRLTKPFRTAVESGNSLARAVKATRDQLKDLNRAQANIDSFRKLSRDAAIAGNQLQAMQQRVRDMARQMAEVDKPTAAMTRAFQAATREAQALKQRQTELQQSAQAVRSRLSEMGISTQNLGQHQRELRQQLAGANQQLATQQQRLAAVAAQQRRVDAAHQAAGKMRSAAGSMTGAGVGATAAGMVASAPIKLGIGESKHYELEKTRIGALGLGDAASKESIEFAKQMKAYGVSQVEKAELMRDALSVFADAHHAEMVLPTLAKMKFANAAVFGQAQGAENERKFMDLLKVVELRGGLASDAEFKKQADMVQRVITATGGRVQADEWLQVIKRGGLAAKGVENEAFYYTLEPLVQEMGGNTVGTAMMSAYQNLYQGRTTKRTARNLDALGLIADQSKVQHDKSGQLSFLNPGALKGADLFRKDQFAWMEKVLLPTLASKGITDPDQIKDSIGSIFSNRTAANLFAQMYMQRDQIHKNMRLNKGADGIEQLNDRATQLPQGKELDTLAKVHDLEKEIGEKVLPLYARGLEWVARAAEGVTRFMQDHPYLAKAMAVAVGVLAAALLVLGPIMLGIAAVIGPYAVLHVLLTKIGVSGGILSVVMRGLGSSFGFVVSVITWVGRALLLNPIGLAVTAIGLAAFLLIKYWEPISAFFTGLWGQVTSAFQGGLGGVLALVANWSLQGALYNVVAPVLRWMGFDLPERFSEFGANMLQGLINGITSRVATVRETIVGIAENVATWFKERLGIHSPSRLFADFGGYTMAGLEQGLQDNQRAPLRVVEQVAKAMAGVGAGMAIGAGQAAASIPIDMRPPIAGQAAARAVPAPSLGPIEIHIHPPAGTDEAQIARMVAAEIRKIEAQQSARARSRLTDKD
ncbi:phage tail tape measure protein [Cupriavidus metallidurans]|uniref:phage tail tape measure protein n=1 Tax=Cupriavidus metallidurans TaxID=119219 RepID=UPI001CCD6F3F|nr:phage tail protein [Cupriavidus metallidurans]UBM11722.1 phage tail protein [Cupriavidus metallidurans]